MSWEDFEGLERGGDCNQCGEPVDEDHHAYCASCFGQQQGWNTSEPEPWREEKPPAGVPSESVIVAIYDLRKALQEAVTVIARLDQRVRDLEDRAA